MNQFFFPAFENHQLYWMRALAVIFSTVAGEGLVGNLHYFSFLDFMEKVKMGMSLIMRSGSCSSPLMSLWTDLWRRLSRSRLVQASLLLKCRTLLNFLNLWPELPIKHLVSVCKEIFKYWFQSRAVMHTKILSQKSVLDIYTESHLFLKWGLRISPATWSSITYRGFLSHQKACQWNRVSVHMRKVSHVGAEVSSFLSTSGEICLKDPRNHGWPWEEHRGRTAFYGCTKIPHSSLRARVKQFYHVEAALVSPFLHGLLSLPVQQSFL